MNEESNSNTENKIFITIINHDLLNCVCCRKYKFLNYNKMIYIKYISNISNEIAIIAKILAIYYN